MQQHLDPHISYFARVDFRDDRRMFGIFQHDRLFGMYLLGKTGSGKTNVMKTLMYQDVLQHRGFCLFDINGDLLKEVLALVPEYRKKDIVLLDATDQNVQLGYNPLKKVSYGKRALIASSILETFQKLWGQQSWGLKLEYILRNVILTLLDQPKANFNDISRILLDLEYQKECLKSVVNKNVIRFWQQEFPKYSKTDILPVLNKVGSFLSIPMLNKILVENQNQISLRSIMDSKKIFLVNLSKGTLGTDGAHLLGSLLLTSLSSASFSRINVEENKRVPFYIYLDEFQNYTTASLTNMFSELRKFKIGFVLAHQYLHQLQTDIKNAVLGNIGTIICFKLGQADAKYMAQEFYPIFQTSDFTNLEHFHIYLKLLINGKSPQAFSAKTITVNDIDYKKAYLYQ
ncbi:type IV secretory system conjugative DNA transfer family protein [Kordia jejudonensis]|uniref:type IV secretory system conjugative DNA transfer family protein n=1 Tax=Kordia jejudonensis TaxID=1348245 RepID=UPI0006296383|nr:type IV secretory system conjugative DNA transfer family protein [Kordia jejudonensis]